MAIGPRYGGIGGVPLFWQNIPKRFIISNYQVDSNRIWYEVSGLWGLVRLCSPSASAPVKWFGVKESPNLSYDLPSDFHIIVTKNAHNKLLHVLYLCFVLCFREPWFHRPSKMASTELTVCLIRWADRVISKSHKIGKRYNSILRLIRH